MIMENRKAVNVLITGAGGDQSIFIWKALKQSSLNVNIIACDCSHLAAGLYRTKSGYVVPRSNSADYLEKIIQLLEKEKIQIVLIGNMEEMEILGGNAENIFERTGAYIVAPPVEALNIAKDKWELVCFLKTNGLDFPKSAIPEEQENFKGFLQEVPFPYIVKSRFGAGSKGLAVVENLEDLKFAIEKISKPIVQEYLFPDDEEYTVGCFCNKKKLPIGSIVMKRKLGHGLTNKAQVVKDEMISIYCEEIARKIGFIGPSNLQLRKTERGPVLFEINPRFSSTESARAYYNFNMPEMCIRNFIFNEEIETPEIKTGHFFRVFDDIFVRTEDIESMATTGFSNKVSGEIISNF